MAHNEDGYCDQPPNSKNQYRPNALQLAGHVLLALRVLSFAASVAFLSLHIVVEARYDTLYRVAYIAVSTQSFLEIERVHNARLETGNLGILTDLAEFIRSRRVSPAVLLLLDCLGVAFLFGAAMEV